MDKEQETERARSQGSQEKQVYEENVVINGVNVSAY